MNFKIFLIMTKQEFSLQTFATIEAAAHSRYAMRWADCKRLAKSLVLMGYGFLLHDLSPIAAQTVAYTPTHTVSERGPLVAGTCQTGETYTMRDGETLAVYQNAQGKKFIIRTSKSGKLRRYYPAKLQK